ncbi:hypothetical protein ESCOMM100M1_22975 [Escherichia coli]
MGILYGYHFLYVVNNAAVEEQRQMKGGYCYNNLICLYFLSESGSNLKAFNMG